MTSPMDILNYLRSKTAIGYKLLRSKDIRGGEITPSELAWHCRIAGKRVRFGVISRYGYAYIVLEGGEVCDGLFHIMKTPTGKLISLT